MKNFFAWFAKPPVLSCIGVIFLSLLIWYGGVLLAFGTPGSESEWRPFESDTVRGAIVLTLFGIWAAFWLWKWLAARMANAVLMKSMAAENAPPADPNATQSAAEVAALNKLMQEAMATLKKSKNASGNGQYMYQLPWYMFVGAPGTGKTTALAESGLHFPLQESMGKKAIGGVGGTRNCDWWFTDEAVMLDTAGRYTTQDSQSEVDKAAWHGFLGMLKKHRRRRPINGVIIAVSAAELMNMKEHERKAQAAAIRDRVKELHERLEIRFPIYVLVTKCDLLAGFIEFFDHLGKEERNQVWGLTFPMTGTDKITESLASLPGELRALEAQLQVRVLDRVQQERDIKRRALIYSFPQQFAALGVSLDGFLKETFGSSRYNEDALLRGVYFSSGTQEGSPIDRVMGSLAQSFGLDRQVLAPGAGSGRSYFIHRLMTEVIFKEAELVGTNLVFERKRRLLQWGTAAALGVLFVIGGILLTVSYGKNKAYVADVEKRVATLEKMAKELPAQNRPQDLLPLLNAAREVPGGYADREKSTSVWERWGLSQRTKLGDGAKTMYHKLLKDSLTPHMVTYLEEQLRRGAANNGEALYAQLRTYLMLGGDHFAAEDILAWADADWLRRMGDASEEQRQVLLLHTAALLERSVDSPLPLDKDLVAQTRLVLAQLSVEKRIYNNVKRSLQSAKLKEFSVTEVGGIQAPQVLVRRSGEPLTRGVPGIYSVTGYKKFQELNQAAVTDTAKDSWVLAQQEKTIDPVKIEQVKATVLNFYFDDYIKAWDAYLADVTVVPFSSLDQGARVATILTGAESPVKKFFVAAAKETQLERISTGVAGESMSKAIKDKLTAAKGKFGTVFEAGVDDAVKANAQTKVTNPVDMHFEGLHKLVGMQPGGAAAGAAGTGAAGAAGAGGAVPLDGTLAMLKDVATYLVQANSAKQSGAPAPSAEVLARLKLEGTSQFAPLNAIIQAVDNSTSGLTKGSERERLSSLWSGRAGPLCRQAIAGRYPMVHNAQQEVPAEDFGNFFAPGGVMDDFFQKNLQQYVDMGAKPWRWRPVGNVSLGIDPGVLVQFQRAAAIRDAFFSGGGRQAALRFNLKTLSVDPALSKFSMDIDGQPFVWTAGSNASGSFSLPSGKGNGGIRVETVPATRDLRTEGAWAWFRMIDKASIEGTPGQAERYKLNFDLDGKRVQLEMTASSAINPFKRDILEQFRCLERF
jgi:type VI secretion system protein ImpL